MGLLARLLRPLTKAVEGQYRPGPYRLPVSGGWLPTEVGNSWNWWQNGYDVIGSNTCNAMVEACVSAYSQTVAMCPGDHWRGKDNGGRERVTTSALSRILRVPNAYDSISDFMLNTVRSLYLTGNAYALALRNSRFEISELHLMNSRQCYPMVGQDGELFYALGGNQVIERQLQANAFHVPARDVLHIRLHTSAHNMLLGLTPLESALCDIAASNAMTQNQIAFYANQARPGIILQTDMVLDKDQVTALRDRWNEQSKGLNAGGTPILTAGLKATTLNITPKDAELAEIMKLSDQNIALAFRIPLQILGLGGSPFSSTEALMQAWIASGLGFCLNHIEEAFGRLFELKGVPDEYLEFDTTALLRSAMKERISALKEAVQGGIFSPNEARRTENLPDVPFGKEPRVQQQVVPLSAAAGIPAAPRPGAPPAAAAQPAPALPPPKPKYDAAALQRRMRVSYQRCQPIQPE